MPRVGTRRGFYGLDNFFACLRVEPCLDRSKITPNAKYLSFTARGQSADATFVSTKCLLENLHVKLTMIVHLCVQIRWMNGSPSSKSKTWRVS